MNINGFNNNHIDSVNANNVTAAIFSALEKKSVDYSKGDIQGFTRRTLGIDLYSQKTDLDIQRQIALTNAGLIVNPMNLSSVKSLNVIAAEASYLANSNNSNTLFDDNTQETIEPITASESNSDKKDSNPFSFN